MNAQHFASLFRLPALYLESVHSTVIIECLLGSSCCGNVTREECQCPKSLWNGSRNKLRTQILVNKG